MKWPVETIDVVAQVNPKLAAADRPDLDEIVCFVPMAAVSEETLSIEAQAERPFSEVAKGYTPFKRGDVLVAKITPCFENGKMAFADNLAHELGFGTTEFHVFRPSERITGPYLFNLLRAPYVRKAGAIKMRGAAGQRRVPADFFAALQIPLPPLDEQKRIAGILDAADALRAKRREALAELDTLLQSTFLDMFGDPVTNPMGWEQCVVGDVVHGAKDGPHVSPTYAESGVPFLSTRHIKPGEVVWEDLKYIDQDEANRQWKKCKPEFGDILYTKGGTTGIAARVTTSEPFAVWVHVALLKPIVKKVHPIWIEAMLNSAYCYTQSQRYTHGIANRDLGLKRMVKIQMYLPPLAEQRGFATIVESVEQQKARQCAHLAELDTLFASLQSRAFRGDL